MLKDFTSATNQMFAYESETNKNNKLKKSLSKFQKQL